MDVVETHNTLASKQVIELGGDLLDMFRDALINFGGGHLVAESLIFRLIVKELMPTLGYDFGDGENQFLTVGLAENTAVKFTSYDAFLNKHFMILGKSQFHGFGKVFALLDLGGGNTAAASGRLDKHRQPEAVGFGKVSHGVEQLRLGDIDDTIVLHHGITMSFMESECRRVISTSGVFDAQNIEIGLEDTVLARIAMHNNEGKVETDNLPIVFKGEVVAVHRASLVSVHPEPTLTLNDDFVYIIFGVVQLTIHLVSTGNRDIMLATETTHNKCYILFHLCNGICC